jgi:hypothetical protein
VASDSMGSSGMLASRMKKIRSCPQRSLIWTWAGSSYLGQQVGYALDRWSASGDWSLKADADVHAEAEHVVEVVRDAVRAALAPLSVLELGPEPHEAEFIVAGRPGSNTFVAHIHADFSWELAVEDRLVAIGGGHQYAAVARTLMHHYIEGGLALDQAQAITHRAIQTVCEVSAYGVALPVQMGMVTARGVSVLGQEDIDAVGLTVDRWKVMERETLLGSYGQFEQTESPPRFDG